MTPKQALEQIDVLLSQMKTPPLNRAEQIHVQNCITIIQKAIERRNPKNKNKPAKKTSEPKKD